MLSCKNRTTTHTYSTLIIVHDQNYFVLGQIIYVCLYFYDNVIGQKTHVLGNRFVSFWVWWLGFVLPRPICHLSLSCFVKCRVVVLYQVTTTPSTFLFSSLFLSSLLCAALPSLLVSSRRFSSLIYACLLFSTLVFQMCLVLSRLYRI